MTHRQLPVWNFRVEIHSFRFSPAELLLTDDDVTFFAVAVVTADDFAAVRCFSVVVSTAVPGGGKLWLLRSRRRGTYRGYKRSDIVEVITTATSRMTTFLRVCTRGILCACVLLAHAVQYSCWFKYTVQFQPIAFLLKSHINMVIPWYRVLCNSFWFCFTKMAKCCEIHRNLGNIPPRNCFVFAITNQHKDFEKNSR